MVRNRSEVRLQHHHQRHARRSRSSTLTATPTRKPISRVYRAQYGLPACTTRQRLLQEGQPERAAGQLSARRHRLGAGIGARSRHGQRHVPGLQDRPGRSQHARRSPISRRRSAPRPRSLGVTVISNSYGGTRSGTTSYECAYNQPGKAVTVSTGDSGYGVAVPGLLAARHRGRRHAPGARRATAAAGPKPRGASGGSGCSTIYAKPSLPDRRAVHEAHGSRRLGGRRSEHRRRGLRSGQPARFGWMVFGGTSVSAPLIGGIYGVTGHGPGGAARPSTRTRHRSTT